MKTLIKFIIISIVSLMIAACATTPFKVAKKYNLGDELTEVSAINSFKLAGWESIDYQSLIIRTKVNGYYLIVLQRPAPTLPFSEEIAVTLTVDKLRAGFDDIVVSDSSGSDSYTIYKIYKLKDREQASEIKKRLS